MLRNMMERTCEIVRVCLAACAWMCFAISLTVRACTITFAHKSDATNQHTRQQTTLVMKHSVALLLPKSNNVYGTNKHYAVAPVSSATVHAMCIVVVRVVW